MRSDSERCKTSDNKILPFATHISEPKIGAIYGSETLGVRV